MAREFNAGHGERTSPLPGGDQVVKLWADTRVEEKRMAMAMAMSIAMAAVYVVEYILSDGPESRKYRSML